MGTGAKLVGVAALCLASLAIGQSQPGPLSSQQDRPWPAPIQPTTDEIPPALSPADAVKTFHMAPGFKLELVAAEPLVKDPILMEFDGDGRLWVLEMHGFAINEKMENSFEPINELVVLEDQNGDGIYDKRNVFMDKLIMPRAFKILDKNCALVGEPPNLWKACDTNGDFKSDTKEKINDTFSKQGVVEHGANGLYWGMDNTLNVAEHQWNLRPAGDTFQIVPSLNRGQWGVTQDDAGRIYRNVNTDPLFVDYVAPDFYVRNANLVRTRGLYESLVKQEESNIWPVRQSFGINRGYRTEIFRKDGSATYYGGVSSPMIYRGDRLPAAFRGQAFVADGPTNLVHLLSLKDDGSGRLAARDFYPKGEFLASTDERFRPVALTPSWDGTFYIADMYRGVSQDGPLQTDYLKGYIAKRQLWKSINHGRIYRVVHQGMSFDKKPSMSDDSPAELVGHLSHPNGWWRDTAQQLLVQRKDKAAIPALKALTGSAPAMYTRLHALWTLDGMGASDPALVRSRLEDSAPEVRAAAVRIATRWLAKPDKKLTQALLARMDDPNWQVRRQLAASLGALPADQRLAPMVALLRRYGADPITVDVAVSGLSGQEVEAIAELSGQPQPSDDAIAMLSAATSKRRDPATAERLLALAADPKQSEPVRLAVLRGITTGLRGAGTDNGGNVAGARAGPLGGGGGSRATPTARLEFAAEPATLTQLASGTGQLPAAAQQVVALIGWPGKPAPPAAPPRSPDEEKLFVAGRAIFADACAGCHTLEGRGAGTLAADLAGSKYVNGAPSGLVRILMHGKEGKLGVMPPLGSAMSETELASALTFIRGSWGNTSSPIREPIVKEWRQAYATRESPWTEAELDASIR